MSEALKKIGDFLTSDEGKAVLAGGADFLQAKEQERQGKKDYKNRKEAEKRG